jgi:hypothetical protein
MASPINPESEAECCPRLDPKQWEEKVLEWQDKKFIKDKVFTFMFMPMNMNGVMTRMVAKVEKAEAKMPAMLCLSDHTSWWNMDQYLEVSKEVPGAEKVTLSGKFISKVYEGDFKETGTWVKDFDAYIKEKGHTLNKMYMWYTTCPECAKKYGKNYVVIIGQV